MKVKLEIDPDAAEDELIIKAKNISPEIEQLYKKLQGIEHNDQIECFRNNVSYYLPLNEILFFETDAKNILGAGFMRISKSTIINLDQIYGLTRSISDCKIQFHDTYKTVYASRRYYKELRTRLDERRSL